MGCCISKCKPKKSESIEEFSSHAQDKLVISAQPPKTHIPLSNKVTPISQLSNKISPSPPSPSNSTSSTSSFTCCTTSNNSTISSCSSLSSASSVLTLKDRSFSNEFLRACYKENPHIVRINSIKELASLSPGTALLKQSIPQRVINGSTPQKRFRSSTSPSSSLRRQKSFRKEPERLNSVYNYSLTSGRTTLRSSSHSRRFSSGDHHNGGGVLAYYASKDQICSKRMVLDSKVKAVNSVSSSLRQESFRPASPNKNSSTALRPCLKNRETSIHRISSKIDESAVGEALSSQDNDLIPMEDIGNPLISLDCFIFL